MLQTLYDAIVSQLSPPPYVFTVQVSPYSASLFIPRNIDVSHIDRSDPIVDIMLEYCVDIAIDHKNHKCKIHSYRNMESVVLGEIRKYLAQFLTRTLPQKNKSLVPLYRWVKVFCGDRALSDGNFSQDIVNIYRYIYMYTHNVEDNKTHIQNGIALLDKLKTKYEAKGFKMEAHSGKRRKRRY